MFQGSKITAPKIDDGNWSIYNQYVIRVQQRDRVKQILEGKEIGTAIYYPLPLHLQPCFANLGYREGDFPESEKAAQEVLALPIYPELEEAQVKYVGEQVLAAVR
jgi:dTDP-4-amino-4,6-dideoxygalactose transaminase